MRLRPARLAVGLPLLVQCVLLLVRRGIGFSALPRLPFAEDPDPSRRPERGHRSRRRPWPGPPPCRYPCSALSQERGMDSEGNDGVSGTAAASAAARGDRWVLLVDDEAALRQAVGDFLFGSGYQVTACVDAAAALELLAPQAAAARPEALRQLPVLPDAIVSDVRMPGTDGIELLRQIREDARLARIPVVLLTAKAMTRDRIAGFRAGADAYLPKPFSPEELLSLLDNLILRRQQMQGARSELDVLRQNVAEIKQLMQRNAEEVVKETDVYLTQAEREVLELLCQGYTNAEIAAKRGVGVSITNKTVQRLYQATNTNTRTALVRWAMQTGYVSKH